jgi:dienelactone hydrolase
MGFYHRQFPHRRPVTLGGLSVSSALRALSRVSSALALLGWVVGGCGSDAAAGALCKSGEGNACSGSDAGGEADANSPEPEAGVEAQLPSKLPSVVGECPELKDGEVMFGDSKVRISMGEDGKSLLGPLVIYWHGTCSNSREAALVGLGPARIARIKELGGMVAAIDSAYNSPDNFCQAVGIPGTSKCPGTRTGNGVWCREDFDVADQIVACAIQQVGIDARRIHTVGMSAGGVMAIEYADARSGYLASVTSYSGGPLPGALGAPVQDPSNKFAAMIVYGGPSDVVGLANFEQLAATYQKELAERGQFSFVCNHAKGHTIPAGIGASTLQFFEDHPFGVSPEPYAERLPESFPDYCALP